MKKEKPNTVDKKNDLFQGQNNTDYHLVTHLTRIEAEFLFEQTYINMKPMFLEGIETIQVPPLSVGHNGYFYLGWDHARKRFIGIKLIKENIFNQIGCQHSQKESYDTLEIPKDFEKELRIQEKLRSYQYPHFLPIFDYAEAKNIQEDNIGKQWYQMVELAGLGDLERVSSYLNLLIDTNIKNDILRHIGKSILEAFQTLHRLNYFHGDITLDNIVMTTEGDIKLIDFEYTTHSTTHFMTKGTFGGEVAYDPPELWDTENYNTEYDVTKVEAWRIGLILLNLATGFTPFFSPENFKSENLKSLKLLLAIGSYEVEFNEINLFQVLNNYPKKGFFKAIRGLLTFLPEERSSIDKVLAANFFNKICSETQLKMSLAYLRELMLRYPCAAYLPRVFNYTVENPSNFSFYLPSFWFFGYVERSTLQQSLLDNLTTAPMNSKIQITNLYGPEGVGKTQLAVWAVHSPKIINHFGLRLWFRSGCNIELKTQFNLLGEQLNLNTNGGAVVSFLNSYIQKHEKPWLIIFDNVMEYNNIVPYLPTTGGHILITSRTRVIPITSPKLNFSAIPVEPMTSNEAINLLYCLIPFNKVIKKLVDITKCLPLALVYHAAYILGDHPNFLFFEPEQKETFEEPYGYNPDSKTYSYLRLSAPFRAKLRHHFFTLQFKDEVRFTESAFKPSLM